MGSRGRLLVTPNGREGSGQLAGPRTLGTGTRPPRDEPVPSRCVRGSAPAPFLDLRLPRPSRAWGASREWRSPVRAPCSCKPRTPWVSLSKLFNVSEPPGRWSMKQEMQLGGLDVLRGERAHRCHGRPRSLCLTWFSPCPLFFIPSPTPSPAVLCPLVATSPPFLKLIQYFLTFSFIFPIGFLAIPLFIVFFSSTRGPT